MYGEKLRVSKFLGSSYRSVFLTRYCVPEFGSGFAGVAPPTKIPGSRRLEVAHATVPSTSEQSDTIRNHGYYRLRYNLDPRIAVHPDAFIYDVPNEGPYHIENMWTTSRFHSSML